MGNDERSDTGITEERARRVQRILDDWRLERRRQLSRGPESAWTGQGFALADQSVELLRASLGRSRAAKRALRLLESASEAQSRVRVEWSVARLAERYRVAHALGTLWRQIAAVGCGEIPLWARYSVDNTTVTLPPVLAVFARSLAAWLLRCDGGETLELQADALDARAVALRHCWSACSERPAFRAAWRDHLVAQAELEHALGVARSATELVRATRSAGASGPIGAVRLPRAKMARGRAQSAPFLHATAANFRSAEPAPCRTITAGPAIFSR